MYLKGTSFGAPTDGPHRYGLIGREAPLRGNPRPCLDLERKSRFCGGVAYFKGWARPLNWL